MMTGVLAPTPSSRYRMGPFSWAFTKCAYRFAAACLRDGWTGCVTLTCSAGQMDYISATAGKDHHTYALMEGDWFEVVSEGA